MTERSRIQPAGTSFFRRVSCAHPQIEGEEHSHPGETHGRAGRTPPYQEELAEVALAAIEAASLLPPWRQYSASLKVRTRTHRFTLLPVFKTDLARAASPKSRAQLQSIHLTFCTFMKAKSGKG